MAGFVLLAGIIAAGGRERLEGTRTPKRTGKRASKRTGTKESVNRDAGTPEAVSATAGGQESDRTFVRSWLAIALVGALVIAVPLSFMLDDTTLRSALVGGLVANAGAAVAFYFAAKSADQARRDILSASLGTTFVPDLFGMEYAKVNEQLASMSLRLVPPARHPVDGAQVVTQSPAPNQQVMHNSPVAVTFAGPVPDLKGKSLTEATTAATAADLILVPDPAPPPDGTVVIDQAPLATESVPRDRQVKATFDAPPSQDSVEGDTSTTPGTGGDTTNAPEAGGGATSTPVPDDSTATQPTSGGTDTTAAPERGAAISESPTKPAGITKPATAGAEATKSSAKRARIAKPAAKAVPRTRPKRTDAT